MLVNTAFWSLLSSAILILFFFSYLFCLNFLNLDVAVDWEIISQLIIAAKAKADFIPILSYTSRSRGLKVEFRKAFIAMTCSICSKLRLPVSEMYYVRYILDSRMNSPALKRNSRSFMELGQKQAASM